MMVAVRSTTDEVAQLHAINRVLQATNTTEVTTFNTKWKKLMETAVPFERGEIYTMCAKWWTSTSASKELSRDSKASVMFKLMLMSIAPDVFFNEHWIQYNTGQPVK
uniref:Uncharacterized protein n=1 Tax=Peronospora matthiolae TaxID=2874970 RepID=A0AAV1UQ52_9STRA